MQVVPKPQFVDAARSGEVKRALPVEIRQQVEQHHFTPVDRAFFDRDDDAVFDQVGIFRLDDSAFQHILLIDRNDELFGRQEIGVFTADRHFCARVFAFDEINRFFDRHRFLQQIVDDQEFVIVGVLVPR